MDGEVIQPRLFDAAPPSSPVHCPRCAWEGDEAAMTRIEDEWGEGYACPDCGETSMQDGQLTERQKALIMEAMK